MKTIKFLIPLLAVLMIACSTETTSQSREVRNFDENFTQINASTGVDLFVKQGKEVEVIVEADEDIQDKVKTELSGGVLKVYFDGNWFSWFQGKSATVYVTIPEITELSASGGADIKSIGAVKADELIISSSGGADVEISLNASNVVLNCSGGADIFADGSTDFLEARSSGGADIKARQLKAKKVVVSSSGGSDVEVYASREIEASASGGSDVDYYGSPETENVSSSGGSDVEGQ